MTTMTKKTRSVKKAKTATPTKASIQVRGGGKSKKLDSSERETAYLLRSPANAVHLRQAIAELDAGKGIEVTLDDL